MLFPQFTADIGGTENEEDVGPTGEAPVKQDPTKPMLFGYLTADLDKRAELPPAEPRAFGAFGRGWNDMEQSGAVALNQLGLMSDESAAKSIANDEFDKTRIPPSQAVIEGSQEIQNAQGPWEATKAIASNPSALLSNVLQSVPASLPSLGLGAAGFLSPMPGGLATGVGAGSFATEFTSTMLNSLREAGVDTMDPNAVAQALKNPELMSKARTEGVTRGVPVGLFDAASAGVAGRIMGAARAAGRPLAGAVGELGMQAGAGMAGEASAQLADKGKITGWGDIGLEGFGELVPGVFETAMGDHKSPNALPSMPKPENEIQRKAADAIFAEQSGITPKFNDGFEPRDDQKATAYGVLRLMEGIVPGISDNVTFFDDIPDTPSMRQASANSGVPEGGIIGGIYNPASTLIQLSLNDKLNVVDPKFMREAGVHELFHFLQRRQMSDGTAKGVFSEDEQNVLNDTFKDKMTVDEMPQFVKNALGEEGFAKLQKRYGTNTLSQREGQAIAFGTYFMARRDGKPVTGMKPGVRGAFEKVFQTIKKIGDYLRGRGITKAEDLFRRVEGGQFAKRGQEFQAANAPQPAAAPAASPVAASPVSETPTVESPVTAPAAPQEQFDDDPDAGFDDTETDVPFDEPNVDDQGVTTPREFAVEKRPGGAPFEPHSNAVADKPMLVNGKRDLGQITAAQAYKLSQFGKRKDASKKFFGGPIRLNFGRATDWSRNAQGEQRWARGFGTEHALGNHGPEIARALGKSYKDLTNEDVAGFIGQAVSKFQEIRQGATGGLRVVWDAGDNVPGGLRYWTVGLQDRYDPATKENFWQVNTAWPAAKRSGQPVGPENVRNGAPPGQEQPVHTPNVPVAATTEAPLKSSSSSVAGGPANSRGDAPNEATPAQNVQSDAQSQARKERPVLSLKKKDLPEFAVTPMAQPTAVDHGVGAAINPATQWVRVTYQTQAGPMSFVDAWGARTHAEALARAVKDSPGARIDPITPDQALEEDRAVDPLMYMVAPRVQGTPAQESALSHVQKAPDGRTLWRKMYDSVMDVVNTDKLALKQGWLDQFASVEHYERMGNKGQLRDAKDSGYKAALNTQNLGSVMAVLLKRSGLMWNRSEGMVEATPVMWVNPATGQAEEVKGFQDIFAGLAKKGLLELWAGWAIANRAQRLIQEGRESRLSQQQIDELLQLEQQYPEFRTALGKWQALNKSVLDFAQDAGVIDPDSRAIWEKNDYVPFYRLTKDDTLKGPSSKKGLASQRSGIKTLTGADEMVGDLFENMVLNMTTLVDASFKNIATERIIGNLATTDALTKITAAMKQMPVHVPAQMAAKALEKIGVNIGKLSQAEKDAWLKVFTFMPSREPDVIHVLKNGKPEYYQVNDPLLLRAVASLNYPTVEGIMKLMRGAKRTLTDLVTLDPGFMLANSFRDTISAALTVPGFVPGFSSLAGYAKAFREDPAMVRLMASGAGGAGFYRTNPDEVSAQLKGLRAKGGALAQVTGVFKTGMEVWHRIGMASENMNRIAVYENAIKQGKSAAEAAYDARDLMNFSMRGDFAAMRFLSETVPFLNARIQGLYRLYRGARDNRTSFLLRGMLLTSATMALYAVNADDERYKELAEWDKDSNYHFFLGDMHFRLPKPFEVGAIFSTIPERLALLMQGTDSTKQTWGAVKRMFGDTFALNPTPQLFLPMVEQWANKQSFFDRPIVGQGLQRLPNQYQYTNDTSAMAKAITGAMPEWVTGVPVIGDALTSPVRLEHVVNGYFGTIGGYLLGASDSAVRAFGDGERAALRTDQIPVVKRFFRETPELSTKWATEFYEMKDETDKLYSAISTLRKQGDREGAMELMQEHRGKLAARRQLNSIDGALTTIRQQMQVVQQDPQMASVEKRRRLDELISRRNQIARRAEGVARSF